MQQRPSLKKWPAWARWLRDLALLGIVFFAVQWWQALSMAKGPAPGLAGFSPDARPLALAAQPHRPVLVHFWATWCSVCRVEEGSIAAIAADHPVLAVATTSGSAQDINDYLARQGLSMPVLMDESGDLARHWGVQGVPASFVIDRDGRIAYATRGFSSEWGLRLRLWLAG